MKTILPILLCLSLVSVVSGAAAEPKRLVPVLGGDSWRICLMPELGELQGPNPKKQHVVDHSFIRAANGKWQLWACIRGTAVGRLLYRWEGESIERGPWRAGGIAARADATFGERTTPDESIQAPHFVKIGDTFHCFYNSDGIRLMTSADGVNYERSRAYDGKNVLYGNGGRDVMVLPVDGEFYAYSTVSTKEGRGYVILRKSRDLVTWTPFKIVSQGGKAGDGPVSAESPFVVKRYGAYYLFRSSSMDGKCYVYRSTQPDDFGVNDDSHLVTVLDVWAPEILEVDGEWFISDLADFQGITVQRLRWEPEAGTE